MKNKFIILDIETTGLSPSNAEITEIGAILINSETLTIEKEYSKLTKINGFVPPFITKLTGITDKLLENEGFSIISVLSELSIFCDGYKIYAHNSSFDKRFVRYYLKKYNINYIETEWVDTIKIFKQKLPGRKTYKLESLIQDLGISNKENHRALDDTKMTLKCLKKVL